MCHSIKYYKCMLNHCRFAVYPQPIRLRFVFCVHSMYLVNSIHYRLNCITGMKYVVKRLRPRQWLTNQYSHAPIICDKLEKLHYNWLLNSSKLKTHAQFFSN